ncbi:MAG: 2-C-methyl-D-erythritol 4-phosphate cytidylyltransferase, partial [Clostridia bacterium]|nr:2-C-methyl-D-erythritol 4-phosphate cytidylyltransferase [Clostridia bacterium]
MTWAIVLAGGSGTRMGAGMNKVLLKVGGVPAIVRSLRAFMPFCQGLVCVCRKKDEPLLREMADEYGLRFLMAPAGSDRQESVANGLKMLPESARYVLVHDGARCLVEDAVIEAVLHSVKTKGSGVAAVPVKDTIKHAAVDGAVIATPERASLKAVQTPQGFTVELLKKAHEAALEKGLRATDDAALVEALGETVYLTPGSERNFKLTTPQDLVLAEALLASHPEELQSKAELRIGNWGPGAQPPLSSHPESTETKTASRFGHWG